MDEPLTASMVASEGGCMELFSLVASASSHFLLLFLGNAFIVTVSF